MGKLTTWLGAAAMAIMTTGCISGMIADGQIKATRDASGAFDTIADYELAKRAASAGLVQFEGMHRLRPDNEDALFLLLKGWVGYGFAFAEDDLEAAVDAGDEEAASRHKARARQAYERAVFYGLELLNKRADGYEVAHKNADTMAAWLHDSFTEPEDAPLLFWLGYGWLARVNMSKDEAKLVGELFIGVEMLERANALDPTYMGYGPSLALGAYHARTRMAELDQSKKYFDLAMEKTQGKSLSAVVNYATRYACQKGDRELFEKLLRDALKAHDPDPKQRLANAIAKRRARRFLTEKRMMDCGFDLSKKLEPVEVID